jgi:hypothetical protein
MEGTKLIFGSSALRDFVVKEGVTKRHMIRITPQAERPYFDAGGERQVEDKVQGVAKEETSAQITR